MKAFVKLLIYEVLARAVLGLLRNLLLQDLEMTKADLQSFFTSIEKASL